MSPSMILLMPQAPCMLTAEKSRLDVVKCAQSSTNNADRDSVNTTSGNDVNAIET